MKIFPSRLPALIAFFGALTLSVNAFAHDVHIEEMADAAKNFLSALTPEQKAKATFPFDNKERENWGFVPRERKGLPLKEMETHQRHLAYALLNSGMSQRGFLKATTIMSLEQILKDIEKGSGPTRDPELYFVSIFGKPGDPKVWGWRVEGHHLALNFTIADGHHVSATPTFMGSNPGEVRQGPRKGLRTLSQEEDLGRKLAQSLTEEQRKTAIFSDKAPNEIITGSERRAKVLEPKGISMAKLNKDQAEIMWNTIREYVERFRKEVADKDLEKIQNGGLENVYFAWAGSTEPGKGHYYRIQGPSFLLEYANIQNDANHVHAVWRDLENDFGEDLLRKHYEQDHKKP